MRVNNYRLFLKYIIYPILYLLFPINAALAGGDVSISSDHMEHLSETDTYVAKGSVEIVYEDTILKADEIQYNGKTGDAVAEGNVSYEDSTALITAERIELNLNTKKGLMYNSNIFYKDRNIHIRGNKVEKTGKTTFHLDEATLTSCDAENPEWHISAKDVTVSQHENIKGWNGKLHVYDKPFLYTPYFWAPLIRDRQTGFLFPSFGYTSKRGTYFKEGFFWAIQENQDATFYLDYYSKKGPAEGLDYRYVLSPESNGELWLYHVRDKEPDRNLFEVKAYHNQEFSNDISGYLKIHTVSHFNYYETMDSTSFNRFGLSSWTTNPFGFSSEERLQKYLESNLHISKSFLGSRAYFLSQGRQSLEGSSSEIPQSLPEMAFILNTRSKNHFSFNMAVKGTNFMKETGQEGFRFDFNPNFYYSYGRLFNITQKIGLRETSYFLSTPSKNEARLLFDSSTTLTTKLLKKYDSFIHIIEPSLEYEYVPSVDHSDIPFFDSVDSIPQASNINYSLTHRLSGLSPVNLEMRFRLSQSYSLLNVDKNFSPLLVEAIFNNNRFDLSMNASYDIHDGKMTETIASIKYKGNKYYIGAGKNFRRATDLDQYTIEAGHNGPIRIKEKSIPVNFQGKLWYDVNGHGVQELELKSTYNHQCWGLSLNFKKKPDEYQIIFAIELKGLGAFSLGSI